MVKLNKKGFTLAELLIVVAVIAVLVAVAIPTFNNQLEKSRQAVDVSNLRGAFAAARLAQIDQGVGPERFTTAVALPGKLQYWYNPDTGELTRVASAGELASAAVGRSVAVYGKATSTNLMADTSNFPSTTIRYNDFALSAAGESGSQATGTVKKAILVKFKQSTDNLGTYVISKITFATQASDSGEPNISSIAAVLKNSDGVGSSTTNPVKFASNKSVNVKDYLTITALDDIGEEEADPSLVYTMTTTEANLTVTDTTGVIKATATTASAATVTITVKDKNNPDVKSEEVSLCVQSVTPLTATTTPLTDLTGTMGTALTYNVKEKASVGGGIAPLTYEVTEATGFESGYEISEEGVFTGTPSATGSVSITVTVTDGDESKTITITGTIS